jgi:hypothetical protein
LGPDFEAFLGLDFNAAFWAGTWTRLFWSALERIFLGVNLDPDFGPGLGRDFWACTCARFFGWTWTQLFGRGIRFGFLGILLEVDFWNWYFKWLFAHRLGRCFLGLALDTFFRPDNYFYLSRVKTCFEQNFK